MGGGGEIRARVVSERPRSLLLSLGGAIQTLAWVLSWARPGPIPGPRWSRPDSPCALFYSVSDPSRSEVGAIPARPGPILLPSVPYRIGPGRAETDFLATSEPRESKNTTPIQVSRDKTLNVLADCLCVAIHKSF